MKTAISMPDVLFREIDLLARKRRHPRSRVIAEAARAYLEGLHRAEALKALNDAYAEDDATERRVRRAAKRLYGKTLDRW